MGRYQRLVPRARSHLAMDQSPLKAGGAILATCVRRQTPLHLGNALRDMLRPGCPPWHSSCIRSNIPSNVLSLFSSPAVASVMATTAQY